MNTVGTVYFKLILKKQCLCSHKAFVLFSNIFLAFIENKTNQCVKKKLNLVNLKSCAAAYASIYFTQIMSHKQFVTKAKKHFKLYLNINSF